MLNTHQVEAVANADAHTNNAGLPTYSQLVVALQVAHIRSCERAASRVKWTVADQVAHDAVAAALRIA